MRLLTFATHPKSIFTFTICYFKSKNSQILKVKYAMQIAKQTHQICVLLDHILIYLHPFLFQKRQRQFAFHSKSNVTSVQNPLITKINTLLHYNQKSVTITPSRKWSLTPLAPLSVSYT